MSIHTEIAPVLIHNIQTRNHYGNGSWVDEETYMLQVWDAQGNWARIYATGLGGCSRADVYLGDRSSAEHKQYAMVTDCWSYAREACISVAQTVFPGLAINNISAKL